MADTVKLGFMESSCAPCQAPLGDAKTQSQLKDGHSQTRTERSHFPGETRGSTPDHVGTPSLAPGPFCLFLEQFLDRAEHHYAVPGGPVNK